MADDRYCYPPDFKVLINKLGIENAKLLDEAERHAVESRTLEGCPTGDFDAAHIKDIHKHLFQDIYEWAGEHREVEIGKGGRWFHSATMIDEGMAEVSRIVKAGDYGQNLNKEGFANYAADVISNLNYVHPFREGNGRTQMEFLNQLAENAGHELQTERITRDVWITASQVSHSGSDNLLKAAIVYGIDSEQLETGDMAAKAVRDYLKTAKKEIEALTAPEERKHAEESLGKVARSYEVITKASKQDTAELKPVKPASPLEQEKAKILKRIESVEKRIENDTNPKTRAIRPNRPEHEIPANLRNTSGTLASALFHCPV